MDKSPSLGELYPRLSRPSDYKCSISGGIAAEDCMMVNVVSLSSVSVLSIEICNVMLQLYKKLVKPHLEYCVSFGHPAIQRMSLN